MEKAEFYKEKHAHYLQELDKIIVDYLELYHSDNLTIDKVKMKIREITERLMEYSFYSDNMINSVIKIIENIE